MNNRPGNPTFNPTVGDDQAAPLLLAPWFTVEGPITTAVYRSMTHAEWANYADSITPVRPTDKTAGILLTIMGM